MAESALNGQVSAGSTPLVIKIAPDALGDYTGNGNTQPALYRQVTATAGSVTTTQIQWFVQNDKAINPQPFGNAATDVPLVGDFTGDGRMDLMLFTPSTGNWTIESPTTNYTQKTFLTNFGGPTGSALVYTPVPADYSGSGTDLAAVYQTNTGQWYIQGQSKPVPPITPFKAGDIPVPGDYDNTGHAELAIYRPSTATWYIQGSPANPTAYGVHVVNGDLYTVTFGGNGDVPVPASYFATATDHSVQEAVWVPTSTVPDCPDPARRHGVLVVEGQRRRPDRRHPHWPGRLPRHRRHPAGGLPAGGEHLPRLLRRDDQHDPRRGTAIGQGLFGGPSFIPLLAVTYSYRALKSGGGTLKRLLDQFRVVDFAATATQLSTGTTTTTTAATTAASRRPSSPP